MYIFAEYAWIIAFLPLLAFLIIVIGKSFISSFGKKMSMGLTVGVTAIGFVLSCFVLAWTLSMDNALWDSSYLWLKAGSVKLSVGWMVDNLSALMLVIVTSISLMVQIYSHEYMKDDEGYERFFAYLAFFNFSMLGLVLSSNLFQMYIFWELVGVSSYLLIGFWFRKPSAADAAKKAFLMNRIGDFGFMLGMMAFLFYSLEWWIKGGQPFLSFFFIAPAAEHVLQTAGPVVFAVICLGLFLGSVAKSAQFPLHTWLPDAMEGPTPISALIHAATMVAAGVFLIARLIHVYELSPVVMNIIAWTGAVTALLAAIIAIVQFDIKKALAYSTCSQLGYMVMAMGVGAYSAGMFHLTTHAYFKAMLFLCSGAVIHAVSNQQDMRYMGGLRKKLPVVAYTYLIGTLSISGLLLSGFWSKEEIFAGLEANHRILLLVLAIVIAVMTSFYMFRTYFMTFEGEYKGKSKIHKPSWVMTMPLVVLAIPSAILGFLLSGKLKFMGIESLSSYIQNAQTATHSGFILPAVSIIAALLGLFIAALLYCEGFKNLLGLKDIRLCKCVGSINQLAEKKFYVDEFYGFVVKRLFLAVSNIMSAFDKYIVDGFVNLSALYVSAQGALLRYLQNGNVQTYAVTLFVGFVMITVAMLAVWIKAMSLG